jgi:flagellar M-ring protein FliF
MSSTNVAAQQFKINNEFRSDIQKNVTSMLGRILGPDKVIVSVVSTMNFDQRKSHEALVTPVDTINQKGIEISLQQLSKTYSSDGGSGNGGVAGTGTTDIPTYQGTTGSGKTNSEENQTTTNFEVNRITNDIDSSPYVVKDLTINVGIEPPVKEDPNSLTQETKDQVQQILVNVVRAALADSGQSLADADLAKKVTVFSHSFASTDTGTPANQNAYWLYSALGALAMALIVGSWVIVARRKKAARLAAEAEAAEAANKGVELPTIDMDNVTADSQIRKQLESLVKKKPEEFVNLLRTWLVDE